MLDNEMMRRVVVATELKAELESIADGRKPSSLRAQVDAEILSRYADGGAKSYDVKWGDQVVATWSVRKSRKKVRPELQITDWQAFGEWEAEPKLMMEYILGDQPVENVRKFAEWVMTRTGELPDGCEVVEVETPAAPIGTMLKVDHEAFAEAAGMLPAAAVCAVLEDVGSPAAALPEGGE